MKHSFKKLVSLVLVLAISFAMAVPAFAATSNPKGKSYSIEISGVTYQVSETVNQNNEKVVTVKGNGEDVTVTKSGNSLEMDTKTQNGNQHSTIPLNYKFTQKPLTRSTSGSISSQFWNFNCSWDTSEKKTNGIYWSLTCDNGYDSCYDNKNTTARSYAEKFMSDVRTIHDNENAEIAASGGALAGAISTAILSATVVGGIAAIVIELGGAVATISLYVNAYNAAQSANYDYDCFEGCF